MLGRRDRSWRAVVRSEPTISFSYLSQLKVARLISAAREASGQAGGERLSTGRR